MQPGPFAEIDDLRARIDGYRPFTPDLVDRMQRWLLPQFVWASDGLGSRERLTLAEVTAFLEREVVSGGHPIDRFLAVDRHRAAFERAERQAREGGRVDLTFIRELHRLLVTGARGGDFRPGEWKTAESAETRRRGRRFRYARPADVPDLMDRLASAAPKVIQTEHPVRAATWLYYHLHLIHPFDSHNGQVGRLMASAVLLHHGYPPLIIDPRDMGSYLDALAACDATVPPSEVEALSPKLEVGALASMISDSLKRVAGRLLDFIEGREVSAVELPRRVVDDQEQLLATMLSQEDLSWRVRGSHDVRALHARVERFLRQLECKGPIYSIKVEEASILRTHAVWREFAPSLPAGDAGIVGQAAVTIVGEPTSNLRFPAPPRLRVVVVGTQSTAQILTQWDDQPRPKTNPGPPRAEQWPDAALDKLLTRAIDSRRRAFEFRVLEENLSATAQSDIRKLLEDQPGRRSMRLRRITTRRGPSGRLGKLPLTAGTLPPPEPEDEALDTPPPPSSKAHPKPAPPAAPPAEPELPTPRKTTRLEGLRPAEPPISF